jgi:hypothetical protein
MKPTPLTDAQERFMYFEVPPVSSDYLRSQRSGPYRVGYVSSEFARELERRISELQQSTQDNPAVS